MNLDCKLLSSLEDTEDLSLPFKLDLIERLYSNDYGFNDEELLTLAEQLNYLDCNKLDDILIFIKHRKIKISSLNSDLQLRIEQIKLENSIFTTFVVKNKIEIIKWLNSVGKITARVKNESFK